MRRAFAGALFACLSLACGEKAPDKTAPEESVEAGGSAREQNKENVARSPGIVGPGAAQPSAAAESAPVAAGGAAREQDVEQASALAKVAGKPRSCALVSDVLVRPGLVRALLSRRGSQVQMLVLSDGEPKLELWGAGAQASAELALPSAAKRAAFAHSGERAFAAWVDDRAHLMLVPIEGDKFGRPRSLAEGVDRRFAPALAFVKSELLLAFTRSVGEAMHVHVAHVLAGEPKATGEHSTLEDLTPAGHGASAPTFIAGASPPSLVAVDAHAGVSPLLELPFDETGRALSALVRTPVSQPYAPPALAAAQLSAARTVVAYTAIGRAAATAIGLVPLRTPEAPTALVPSHGYGELTLSVAQQSGLAVFAVEAFKEPKKDAARKVLVGVVDAAGVGEWLELGVGEAHASAPSLLAGARQGEFMVAYSAPSGVHRAQLVCSP